MNELTLMGMSIQSIPEEIQKMIADMTKHHLSLCQLQLIHPDNMDELKKLKHFKREYKIQLLPEACMYLALNRIGKRYIIDNIESITREEWIRILIKAASLNDYDDGNCQDLNCLFHVLQWNPLLCN